MQRGARFYNRLHARSSHDGPISRLPWFELYCAAAAWVTAQDLNVLELGCGTGWLASLLANVSGEHFGSYVGIDFSRVALKCAAKRVTDKRFVFLRRNLDKARLRWAVGRAIVAVGVLEHLAKDRELIAKLPVGCPLWFSVARFSSHGHVRQFSEQGALRERYGELLTELHIVQRERFFIATALVARS